MEIPPDKIKDKVKEFLNKGFKMETLNEVGIESYKIQVSKINENKIISIRDGNSAYSATIDSQGKLVRLILYTLETPSEDERIGKSLIINIDKNNAIYTEGKIVLDKGKIGSEAIKSIEIIKNEEVGLEK